jgi:type VII secretion-associated serine protease mycosin
MSSAGFHRSRRARSSSADFYARSIQGIRAAAGALAGLAILTAASIPLTGNSAQSATQAAQAAHAVPAVAADGIRASQWWLNAVHGPGAWKWTRGAQITVAVLDTGVDGHHPDLTGQVIQGPDYTTGGRALGDKFWGRHGTLMASIISGHGHGPGKASGVMGIAPQAKILSIRVTWENEDPIRKNHAAVVQNNNSIAKGIRYAVDHGADVINMSLGGGRSLYDGNPVDEEAVKYALSKNVVLVASMGNDGAGANGKNFPAAYPGVIAVGAVDRSFKPWKGSNHRDYVSVAAPGKDIVGADDLGTHYSTGIGTSPSSAMVAGVAALIKSRYPKLTTDLVKQAIEKGATHKPASGRNIWVGAGVLDARAALVAAHRINKSENGGLPSHTPPPVPPKASPSVVDKPLNLLLIVILGGGGGLVLVGLVLGWLQRRRPGAEPEPIADGPRRPVEAFAGLPPEAEPREAAQMYAAPVGVATWQSVPQPAVETEPPPQNVADRFDPGALQPYEVPASMAHNGNGNGHRSNGRVDDFRIEDFRVGLPTDEAAVPPRDDLRIGDGRDVSPEFASDPLSGDLGSMPESTTDTPLADESWQSLLNGRDQAGIDNGRDQAKVDAVDAQADDLSQDDLPTNIFPAIDPLDDPLTGPFNAPREERPERPGEGPFGGTGNASLTDPLNGPLSDPLNGPPSGPLNRPLGVPPNDPLSGPLGGPPNMPRAQRPEGTGNAPFGGTGSTPSNDESDESFGRPARPRAPEDHPFGSPAQPKAVDDEDFRPPWW